MSGARPRPEVSALRTLHEWLGLICLAGLLVVGVTGGAVVFLGELFVLQYGDMVEVPGEQRERQMVDIDHLLVSAKEGHGAPFAAQGILMPHSRIPLDVALVYGVPEGAAADEPLMLVVNPHTGEYRGSFWLDQAIGHELVHLHADLLAGGTGRLVVVGLGVATIFFTLSGLYLWWPRSGSAWRKLLNTAFRRRWPTVYALHGLLGIWLGPFLVFYSLTGIATAKPAWFSSLMQSPFTHAPTFVPDDGRLRRPVLSLSEAVAMGQADFPERRLASLNFGPEGRLVGMTFKAPGDLNHFYGDAHVWVDRQEGRVRESFLAGQKSPATATGAAMHSLHAGFFFGVPGMAATVLSGMGLTVLSGLGLVLWWRRRKKAPL